MILEAFDPRCQHRLSCRAGALGCMRQQVAMRVNRAPLHRHAVPQGDLVGEPRAVDDEELGTAKTTLDEIITFFTASDRRNRFPVANR